MIWVEFGLFTYVDMDNFWTPKIWPVMVENLCLLCDLYKIFDFSQKNGHFSLKYWRIVHNLIEEFDTFITENLCLSCDNDHNLTFDRNNWLKLIRNHEFSWLNLSMFYVWFQVLRARIQRASLWVLTYTATRKNK